MMAMLVGAATLTSSAASAAPTLRPYPPPPPALVVNRGWVRQYSYVRATGRKYAPRERVYVTITYRARPHDRPSVRRTVVYADRAGRFSLHLRMTGTGRAVISATGTRSGSSASAVVIVQRRGHGHGFQQAAVTTGLDTGSTGLTPGSATPPPADRGLAIAGLGVVALLGGAVITSRVTRRRRRVYAG
jgi:hypothetical protein